MVTRPSPSPPAFLSVSPTMMILDFSAFPCSSRVSLCQSVTRQSKVLPISPRLPGKDFLPIVRSPLTPFLREWTKTRPSTPSAKRTPRGRSTATMYSLSRIGPAGPPGSAPCAAAAAATLKPFLLIIIIPRRPVPGEEQKKVRDGARGLGARGSAFDAAPPRRPGAAAPVMARAGGVSRWGAMGGA